MTLFYDVNAIDKSESTRRLLGRWDFVILSLLVSNVVFADYFAAPFINGDSYTNSRCGTKPSVSEALDCMWVTYGARYGDGVYDECNYNTT